MLLKSAIRVRRAARGHDVIYTFSLDTLLIGWLASLFRSRDVKLIYDVADIRDLLLRRGVVPAVLRAAERFLLRRTAVVVVASPAFIEGYFRGIQRADARFVVIENKVEADLLPDVSTEPQGRASADGVLKIGYFGLIRCEHSLRFLKKLVEEGDGAIRLTLRGIFLDTESYEADFDELKHACYGGPFVNPEDLQGMYASVDLVWGAHMHGESNTRWAISNRFYQACYFNRPLITQVHTQDARKVQHYRIGCVIDLNDQPASGHAIRAIRRPEIDEWKGNIRRIPREVYTLTDEHERLLDEVAAAGRRRSNGCLPE